MYTPNFLVFTHEGMVHYGFSEKTMNRGLRLRRKNFIVYENGSPDCSRCLESLVMPFTVTLPLFRLLWCSERLKYISFFLGEVRRFSYHTCLACDREPNFKHQAIIHCEGSMVNAHMPIILGMINKVPNGAKNSK